ncbi:hypothetical protein FACS189413_03400 [Bacteroidia bacterium]|nr:hypothetical protein FACS189413_03400 [Bacteroidia bacterium]
MDEEKKQHLEFIQNVITRMNTNSFQIKGMAVTIVSALLAIYASTNNIIFVFLGIAPTFLFWFLDSYYLQQERKFRGVYNNVAGLKNNVEIKPYEMPIQKFEGGRYCFSKVFFSKTIAWLYGTIVFLLLIGGLILKFKDCITITCKEYGKENFYFIQILR